MQPDLQLFQMHQALTAMLLYLDQHSPTLTAVLRREIHKVRKTKVIALQGSLGIFCL